MCILFKFKSMQINPEIPSGFVKRFIIYLEVINYEKLKNIAIQC